MDARVVGRRKSKWMSLLPFIWKIAWFCKSPTLFCKTRSSRGVLQTTGMGLQTERAEEGKDRPNSLSRISQIPEVCNVHVEQCFQITGSFAKQCRAFAKQCQWFAKRWRNYLRVFCKTVSTVCKTMLSVLQNNGQVLQNNDKVLQNTFYSKIFCKPMQEFTNHSWLNVVAWSSLISPVTQTVNFFANRARFFKRMPLVCKRMLWFWKTPLSVWKSWCFPNERYRNIDANGGQRHP